MNEMLYYDLKDASGVAPGLAMQISRELGRRIVAGHYKEDALIEDEGKLSQRFGVSKSVIREGVKLLVSKGLLEVKRGSGTRVRRRASWALLDCLRTLPLVRQRLRLTTLPALGSDEIERRIQVDRVRVHHARVARETLRHVVKACLGQDLAPEL